MKEIFIEEHEVDVTDFYDLSTSVYDLWKTFVLAEVRAWVERHKTPAKAWAALKLAMEQQENHEVLLLREGQLWLAIRVRCAERDLDPLEVELRLPEGHYRERECVGEA